jgi:enoyl-CoA hydratase
MADFVHVERGDDGVAVLRLDRPPANALSTAVLEEIAEAARGLTADPPGAVVVTGGDRIFAAGADIAEFGGTEEATRIAGHFREAFDAVAGIPHVTIAAVAGFALGGGCELALSCDLRMAAETAKFGQPEVLLGIIPGAGGTQRLTRLVGPARRGRGGPRHGAGRPPRARCRSTGRGP